MSPNVPGESPSKIRAEVEAEFTAKEEELKKQLAAGQLAVQLAGSTSETLAAEALRRLSGPRRAPEKAGARNFFALL